jgi:hypothetical protein
MSAGAAHHAGSIHLAAVLQQDAGQRQVALACSQVKRAIALVVWLLCIRRMCKELRRNLGVALLRGHQQRGEAVLRSSALTNDRVLVWNKHSS